MNHLRQEGSWFTKNEMTDDTGHYVLEHCSSYLFLHVLLYVPRTCSMFYAGVKTGDIEYQPDFGRNTTSILFIAHYSSLDGIGVFRYHGLHSCFQVEIDS